MALINQNPQQNQQVQPQQGAQKPKGSGFTNLQQIIQANRNNRLGQTIGQGVQQQTSQVRSGIQSAQQQFGQGLQKSQEQLNKDKEASQQALSQIAQNYGNQPQQNNQPAPVQSSLNLPGNFVQTFQKLGKAEYTGPRGLENYDTLQAQAQSAENLGQAAIDPNARRGLLQRFVGGPQYSQGQQRLDNLLLGQTAGKDLALARRATQGLQQNVVSAQQQAGTQADLQRQALQRAAEEARGNVGDVSQRLEQSLQDRAAQATSTNKALFDRLKQVSSEGTPTGEDLNTIKNLFGLQDDKFITSKDVAESLGEFDPTQITKQSIASQDDLERARALEQISNVLGQNYSSGLSDEGLNQYTQTTGINPYRDQLLGLQSSRAEQFNKEWVPTEKQTANREAEIERLSKEIEDAKNYYEGNKYWYNDQGETGAPISRLNENLLGATRAQRDELIRQRATSVDAMNRLKDKYNYYGLGETPSSIIPTGPTAF